MPTLFPVQAEWPGSAVWAKAGAITVIAEGSGVPRVQGRVWGQVCVREGRGRVHGGTPRSGPCPGVWSEGLWPPSSSVET